MTAAPDLVPAGGGSLSAEDARHALAFLPSGVTVVTTMGTTGPVGMTATSVCSATLTPPRLVVGCQTTARTFASLATCDTFAVNVLAEGDGAVALTFADATRPDKFSGTEHRLVHGTPVLAGAVAWYLCVPEQQLAVGDHILLVGRVRQAGVREAAPLIRYRHAFRRLE